MATIKSVTPVDRTPMEIRVTRDGDELLIRVRTAGTPDFEPDNTRVRIADLLAGIAAAMSEK